MWPGLILLLLAALVHAQLSQTSQNNPLRLIAASAPKKQEHPICCLRPKPSNTSAEDDLLSFEDWKAKQQSKEPAAQESNVTSLTEDNTPEPLPTVEQPKAEVASGELRLPHRRIPLTDRFNYAGLDCSARVHSAHRSAKSALNILSHKKDKYMLSPCNGADKKKFVVVELCEDIRIDTVQLANFEFFSGVFKDFTVSVAKTFTTDQDGWTVAGTYRANNTRAVQSFHPPPTLTDFYRYIRIDFHSHYGTEYYCPISLLRVFGLTHLEQWKWDLWEEEYKAKKAESTLEDFPELPTTIMIEDASTASSSTLTSSSSDPIPQPSFTTEQPSSHEKHATHESTPTTTIDVSEHAPTLPPSTDESITNSFKSSTRSATLITPVYTQPAAVSIYSSGESIYRTIMNRLTALELNHTLYARYAQEQHLGVREALRRLSEDVGRLEGIGKAQSQSYQRSIHEWQRHQETVDAEYQQLARKVDHLAKEIVIEKWLSIAQMLLLIVVLVFVGITRGTAPTVNISRPRIGVREWGRRHLSLTSWNGRSRSVDNILSPKPEPDQDVKIEFPKSPDPEARPMTPTRHRVVNPKMLTSPISTHSRLRKRAGTPTSLLSSPPISQSKSWSALAALAPKRSRTAHLHPVQRGERRRKKSVDVDGDATAGSDESDMWVDMDE